MIRRLGALAALLILSLVGCGGSTSSSSAPTQVTVVLDWTPNTNHAGVYAAKAKGYYADAGLDVQIVEPDQNGAIAQLAAGNAEFGFSAAEQLLPARAQGAKVTSIATVMRTNTSSLIVPTDRAISRPRDLQDHTYGGYGGDLESALVGQLVRCDGGDPNRVKYAEVGNVDYSVGFKRHQYDAVWVFDGWDTIRLRDMQKLPVRTIAFRDHLDCIPDWYTPILVATDDVIAKHPEIVTAFLAATAKGYELMRTAPTATADLITANMPEADADLWRRSARFIAPFLTDSRGGWGYQDPGVWQRFNAFMLAHRLPTVRRVSSAFTNRFVPTK